MSLCLLNAVRLSTTSEVLVCVYAYVLNIDNAYKHKKHKNIISFIKVSKNRIDQLNCEYEQYMVNMNKISYCADKKYIHNMYTILTYQ